MGNHRQLVLPLQLQEQSLFDNFIPGANRMLLEQLQHFSRQATETLIYVYGEQGGGKTHLLTACCHAANTAGVRAVYLDLARYVGGSLAVLEGMHQFELVVLDSLECVGAANKRLTKAEQTMWQQALYELMYEVRAAGGRLLVAANEGPQSLTISLPDLRTRLAWGPCWSVKALTEADRAAFLKQRALQKGMQLDDDAVAWILRHQGRDTAALTTAIELLATETLRQGKKPSLSFVRAALKADAEPLETSQSQ